MSNGTGRKKRFDKSDSTTALNACDRGLHDLFPRLVFRHDFFALIFFFTFSWTAFYPCLPAGKARPFFPSDFLSLTLGLFRNTFFRDFFLTFSWTALLTTFSADCLTNADDRIQEWQRLIE